MIQSANPRPRLFLAIVALAYVGGVIAYLPLLTLLLPLKIEALSGAGRIGLSAACVTAGAVAASLSIVVFGWLSDRSRQRGGGRRRWIAGGGVATAASYAAVALATTPAALIAAIAFFQVVVNAMLAPLMAIMAEEIADGDKGVAGGLLSLGPPTASAFSAWLVGEALLPAEMRLALVPAVVLVCIVPLLLVHGRAAPVAADQAALALPPRRDLIVAGVSRLLFQIASVVTQGYLLFYFESIVAPAGHGLLPARVGHLMTLAFVVPLPIALLLGRLSDRARRRKPFLLLASAVAAAGLVGMAGASGWTAGAIAFIVYTTGASVFVALQAAFAMQLLPNPDHRGRDLGLLNLANTVPSLLGPPLAWWLATPQDFGAVMLLLAGLTVAGGLAMLGVRSWR